ncbi:MULTISPECIES: hypothetical protein [Thermoanaerobacterium]|uniref:Uncharacterized protein n=2 Tax=Thermoanaerobacterium TaxID=28895 RepID=W9EDH5_9THEO|nr:MULTISPECIES: hypothetical protein [Thermoanaerobacterium]AFK87433.1 hypothetical protein Tsac_2435 [Thermoanaerobacterium saccharolyticum JW/SL-YS485]ETO37804.1 hypothetical protein V518_2058 [Thermoanaerobacterium aotearoense SCUT27]
MRMMDYDTFQTEEMICPYCGYANPDSFEFGDNEGERECENCGKMFEYTREIEIRYTTTKRGT